MNLKNKTKEELWDMADKIKTTTMKIGGVRDNKTNRLKVEKLHKIYGEIIEREKSNE